MSFALPRDRFDDSWRSPLSNLLGLGRAAGADFIEFFLERVNYISCMAENDAVTSISPRLVTGAGVRVFVGSADCYVSTNDVTYSGLRKALDKALAIMGLTAPSAQAFTPEVNLEIFRDYASLKNKDQWLGNCSSMAEMGDVLLAANGKLAEVANHIESRQSVYFRDWLEVLVATSDVTFARDIRLTQSVGYSLLCVDQGDRASLNKRVGATYRPDFLRTWD